MSDNFDLARFVAAQDADGTYARAVSELRHGRKSSHWMWFVFPQLAGLGFSAMSQRYAISGLDEARAYVAHSVLGPRLIECAELVAATPEKSASEIFGGIDAQKLHSSMTLFAAAVEEQPIFIEVIARFFDGGTDPGTQRLLAWAPPGPDVRRQGAPGLI